MYAKVGYRPSHVWKSLLAGKDQLLSEGLFWHLGNGKSIKIWKDKWINIPMSNKIISPVCRLSSNATINELINLDDVHGSWNLGLIQETFSSEEANISSAMPLNSSGRKDQLIWNLTKNGHSNVKFAYHLH